MSLITLRRSLILAAPAIIIPSTSEAFFGTARAGLGNKLLPETEAWIAAVVTAGGSVTAARARIVNNLIAGLKAAGLWSIIDRVWIFASASAFQADIDLKALATVTPINSPNFTADSGYAGNGTTSYVDTNFNPTSAGGNYGTNSASFSIYSTTANGASNRCIMGAENASPATRLFTQYLDGNNYWTINNGGSGLAALTPTNGFYTVACDGSGSALYKNGSSAQTAGAPSGTPNNNFFCGANEGPTSYSTERMCVAIIGGFLTSTQAAALNAAVVTYLTSIGTI